MHSTHKVAIVSQTCQMLVKAKNEMVGPAFITWTDTVSDSKTILTPACAWQMHRDTVQYTSLLPPIKSVYVKRLQNQQTFSSHTKLTALYLYVTV